MSLAYVADAKRRSHDPTGTSRLRASFRAAGQLQLRQLRAQLRMCIIDHDLLGWSGINVSVMAVAPDIRLGAFGHWLTSAATKYLSNDWAVPFVDRAWRMGVAAAAREVGSDPLLHQARGHVPHQLLRQELRGIIAAVVQQVGREAARNFSTPHRAWQHLSQCFDKVAGNRIMALANTETVRAFNMAKLAVYGDRGITHVGVDAELMPPTHDHVADRTLYGIESAGDERVCPICEDLEDGGPYTLGEAVGLIPAHVGCRCSYTAWTRAVDSVPVSRETSLGPLYDFNPNHEPGGSPEGGRFASGGGGEGGGGVAEAPVMSSGGGNVGEVDYSNLRTMPSHIEGVPIFKKPLGGAMLAIGGSGGIAVSTSKRAREAWKDMAAYQKKAFESGWMSSPHPNHTLWHELAHVKVKKGNTDHDSYLSNLRGGSNPHFKQMAEKVSKYAGVNGHEMVAEVFAATRAGRTLDADVMDYYDKVLKGPKP